MSKRNKRLTKASPGAGRMTDLSAQAQAMTSAQGTVNPSQAQAYAAAWGAGGLFGPGTPQRPVYDLEDGARVFDYMAGVNLYITPRSGYGLTPFTMLRNFADLCEEVRIVIEAFKREIRSMEWAIEKTDSRDKTDYSAEQKRLTAFWTRPDGATEFDAWLNAVLEDVLVLDALTLWLEGGADDVKAVQQIDGATIRPLLDRRGRVPLAPIPAYMQAIKGQNWTWFTSDFMLYLPFNAAINSPYGKSPTEYILTTINTSIRRKLSAMQYWDQTNVPEALVGLPDTMPVNAIKEFQEYFDALLTGDINRLRRLKFMPVQSGALPVHEFRRPDGSSVADEWVLKMASWAFGFLPSEFGIVAGAGLGGSGFMAGQENTMYRFGVGPIVQFIQNFITTIIRRQTKAPLGFKFVNIGPAEDKEIAARLDEINLRNGVIDINVLREKAGQKPIPGARPFFLAGQTPILLEDLFNPPAPPAPVLAAAAPLQLGPGAAAAGDVVDDDGEDEDQDLGELPALDDADLVDGQAIKLALDQWKLKAQRRVKDGRPALCDPPEVCKGILSPDLVSAIKGQLQQTGPSVIGVGFELWKFDRQIAKAKQLKKKSIGNQHPTHTRREFEADMAQALAKVFKRLAKSPALQVTDPDQAQALASGPGEYWDQFRDDLGAVLTDWLERGAQVGIDEARTVPLFQVQKLAKADAGDVPTQDAAAGADPDRMAGQVGQVGINWDLVNMDARNWALTHGLALIKDLETNTRGRMLKAVVDFIRTSQDIPDLTRALVAIIDDPRRAALIAQTESTRSFAEGNTQAWRAQGIEGRKWFNVEDDNVCPICRQLGGQTAALGKPFKGPGGKDIDNPPGHPGCRCYVQPVEYMGAPPARPPAIKPAPPAKPARKPRAAKVPTDPAAAPAPVVVPGQPGPGDGPKVGDALTIAKGKMAKAMKDAIDVINSVHSDGDLKPLPAETSTSKSWNGVYQSYRYSDGTYKGAAIKLSTNGQTPKLTMAHEVGHWLDQQALGAGKGFASSGPELAAWRDAVTNSQAYKALEDLAQAKTMTVSNNGVTWTQPTDRAHVKYLLSTHELFARSYAQYIATKSKDAGMVAQLDRLRYNDGDPYHHRQWAPADFEPIAAAFDEVFKNRGWIK